MFFLPFSLVIFLIFILLLPVIFVLFSTNVIGFAFSKLGIPPQIGMLFYLVSLASSVINIPIYKKHVDELFSFEIPGLHRFLFNIRPEFLNQQVLAVNVGGCILPLLLALFLFFRTPIRPVIICTLIMIILCKILARPTPGIGIAIPAFIPPIVAAILAVLLAGRANAPAVAYISGVLGVLIGADLLNLGIIKKFGYGVMSIGGAGVFDGIFLVGIIAVLIA
ncbi:MAG: DUF1614 domain-containing protein [candidate division WOR-3 bacterium]